MLSRRFSPCIVGVCVVALISLSYVGYRAYQNDAEFKVFLSESEAFRLALATDRTSVMDSADWQTEQREGSAVAARKGLATNQTGRSETHGGDVSKVAVKVKLMKPERVAKYNHGDPHGSVVVRNSPSPETPSGTTWTEHDAVTQFLELPNGTVVETLISPGTEIREGDEVSPKYIAIHTPPENTVEIDGVEHKIPPGVDRHQHLQKLFWSHELGVPVEETERMVANRELIVKPEGDPLTSEEEGIMTKLLRRIPKFDSFLRSERPDLYEAEPAHDHPHQFPSESWKVAPGDSSSYLRQSSRDDSIPQGKGEKQAPVPSEPPSVSSQETGSHEGISPERFGRAQQLIDQYGTEEGLRRFREMDPEAARQFERERREPPVRSESDEEPSTQ